jgi:RNA-dependent RNA polymerase
VSEAPRGFEENFERSPETVRQFGERISTMTKLQAQTAFMEILLSGMRDTKVGLYSTFHDSAIWKFGYGSSHAERLAHMCVLCHFSFIASHNFVSGNVLLDANKTGLRLKQAVFQADKNKFGERPISMGGKSDRRPGNSNPFVLDDLREAGKLYRDAFMTKFDRSLDGSLLPAHMHDPDLIRPFEVAKQKSERLQAEYPSLAEELNAIKEHVDTVYNKWYAITQNRKEEESAATTSTSKSKKAAAREPNPYDKIAADFHKFPQTELTCDVPEVAASYACKKSESFAFSVAYQQLCTIKAKASPDGSVTLVRSFDLMKDIPGSGRRMIRTFVDLESSS